MFSTLLTALNDGIFTITINRPEKLNALNATVLDELDHVLTHVYNDASIKSAIITGAGPKAFVAGADIQEFVGISIEEAQAMAKKGQDIFFKIEQSPKPILACVNGFALGGGCELAMSCHMRIASEQAKFGQPEVNLGLIPGYGGTQRLVQLVGKGRALEMILSGTLIDAKTAHQYGLVNQVVAPEILLEKGIELLSLINSKAPLAVGKCIEAANAVFDQNSNGYQVEVEGFGFCFGTEDKLEGTSAFLEKRKPNFKGK